MNAKFNLLPDAIDTVGADEKHEILSTLAELFARVYELDAPQVLESLEERENLGSTGFGRGVAIPHARIEGISRPVAALLKLENAVDFDAADGMPVDLVIGLLSPSNAGATHLHALAAISRMVRDEDTHQALVEAMDNETLFALLTNVTDRDAA
jgi:PTS system nitrogen regulatory IIA component